MKLNKIFAIALAALTLTACSDDDDADVNSKAGVSVSMLDPTLTVGENSEYFNVPLQVTGETNGQVIVTLEVKAGPADPNNAANPTIPAEEGTHFYVTSKTIHIPAGETSFGVEIRNEWAQGVIDDDKVFTISIVKAQGATVGAVKDCVVTIANVDDAYTAMLGTWKFTANDADGIPVAWNLTLATPDSDDEDYGSLIMGMGFMGYNFGYLPLGFEYDKENAKVEMCIYNLAFATTSIINFGFNGVWITNVLSGGDMMLDVNNDLDEMTVDPSETLQIDVYYYPQLTKAGWYDRFTNINLKRLN